MVELQSIFKKAYWTLAAGGLLYVLFICAVTFPEIQRFVLYAHKFNPSYWQNLNQVEQFGFLKTQVQPFNLVTPDNETLYGWHLLPLHLVHEHEKELMENTPFGPSTDYTETVAFKILASNPNSRVVVSFHGNAAHLGSANRPNGYNTLLGLSTPENPVHVFAIDYRGYGLSTGNPTEEGLVTDGVSLLNFLTAGPLSIPTSRIAIVGQSLGTAVTAAVAERFAYGSPDPKAIQPTIKDAEPFAGVILLASFSSISNVLESYSIKGFTPPMLSPLLGYPRFQNWVLSHIVDHWDTAGRVARLAGINPAEPDVSGLKYSQKDLDLTIVHALNDADIPWYEGRRVWVAATGENIEGAPGAITFEKFETGSSNQIQVWENSFLGTDGKQVVKRVRWERIRYGGHNRVASSSVAGLAVLRAFEN
ncbi:hypothetical protein N7466_004756 [Penicillium verhagenii]|uniref:uncharacterized protein n=1 Tax=Penicillium verhagenii TaxID=1562060 RepID=UPI002545697B|nr:uncharacterized protein N7466_004756 [Penicillium verhagenii]KAJ5935209.1 hypothetical protein N7466_004756 [Penicillium verhagenii]